VTGVYEALPGLILAITALIWQYVHTHGGSEPPK
jgi:hypothetical protein